MHPIYVAPKISNFLSNHKFVLSKWFLEYEEILPKKGKKAQTMNIDKNRKDTKKDVRLDTKSKL